MVTAPRPRASPRADSNKFAKGIGLEHTLLAGTTTTDEGSSLVLLHCDGPADADYTTADFYGSVHDAVTHWISVGRRPARYVALLASLERLVAVKESLGPAAMERALAVLEADAAARILSPPTPQAPTPVEVHLSINPELHATLHIPKRKIEFERNFDGSVKCPRVYPVLAVLADTGARLNAVCSLRGQDVILGDAPAIHFRTQWHGAWRALKTKDSRRVAIPPETAALLPVAVAPDWPLWPNRADHRRPMNRGTVSRWLTRAVKAVGISDHEKVDTHSLRRAWVRTAKRENIPNAVGMRVTGHVSEQIYNGYDANSVDDTRPVVDAVHAARVRASSTSTSTTFGVNRLPRKVGSPTAGSVAGSGT